jgi:hypothetical protein
VTSLSAETGRRVAVPEVLPVLERHLAAADLAGHGPRTTRQAQQSSAGGPLSSAVA